MYRFMSEEEIEIGQISDLKMIHLYQLGGSDALAVYYGNNKQINLCAMDANYNLLIQQVLTLYSQCEQKDSIIIDAPTRQLLNRAVDREDNHTSFFHRTGHRYKNKESLPHPAFASDGVLRETLLPMVKYYLHQLYHMWDTPMEFAKEPCGWNKNCVLKIRQGRETLILPIRMDFANKNSVKVIVGNFLQDLYTLSLEITYREDRIFVLFESEDIQLTGESHFELSSQKVNAYTSIRVGGQVVYHQTEPIEQLTASPDALQCVPDNSTIWEEAGIDFTKAALYKLPWGGLVLCNTLENADTQQKRSDFDTIYIERYGNKLALRQYSYSLIENLSDGLKLRTDGAHMRKLYYGTDKKCVETLFLPVGYYSGWDYKEYLRNRYFYDELEEIK